MYTYYEKREEEEHYPYATEIARILYERHLLVTKNEKLAVRLTKALLENLRHYKNEPELYYETSKGLTQVYKSYLEVITFFDEVRKGGEANKVYEKELDGHTYSFKFLR